MPTSKMPLISSSHRTARPSTDSGASQSVRSMTIPMMNTLRIVPIPSFSLRGIHMNKTTIPMRIPTVPIGMPVLKEIPCAITSHGERPRPARTIIAAPNPKRMRPNTRRGIRAMSCCRDGIGNIDAR